MNPVCVKLSIFILFFLELTLANAVFAQDEQWDVYLSKHEKGVGSTLVNMGLNKIAPVKNFSFVLITGVQFSDCTGDGMPSKKEFDNLYAISDTIKAVVARKPLQIPVGSFTYQCERLDYYYLNDTTGIRAWLLQAYQTQFPNYRPYISIKADKNWDAYLKFLYPNEETQEYMRNEKVVTQLYNAGDNLQKERPVTHFLYFSTEKDRKCFIQYAHSKGFAIVAKEKADTIIQPYKLQIARADRVPLAYITKLTRELHKQANQCRGRYDGWETIVIKTD
jgi:hypothetical protein